MALLPRRPRSLAVAAAVTVLATLAVAGTASAAWTSPGRGDLRATSTSVPTPAAPTAALDGRTVTLQWRSVTMADGAAATGYTVTRTTGATSTVVASCQGAATSCVDPAVPVGTSTYTVVAAFRTWTSDPSATTAVTVRAPSLTLTATVSSLPATLTGTLSDAVAGAPLTFRLDDPTNGTLLTASPTVVATRGATSVSVLLPAGTTTGAHRVYAVAAGEIADAPVTVVTNGAPTAFAWIGNGDGRARTGDSLRITYSQPLDLTSLAPSDPDGNVNVVVNLLDGAGTGGHDLLTVTGPGGTTVAFGDIDLGSTAFAVNDITFGATDTPSTLRWNATARTLTLTFGKESSSSAKTVSGAVTATYRPATGLRTSTNGSVTGTAAAVGTAF